MKTLLRIFVLMLVMSLLIVNLCTATEISVAGGGAPYDNVLVPIKEPFEKATGIKLNIIASGPKVALIDMDKKVRDALLVGLTSVNSQIIPEMRRPFLMVTIGEPKPEVKRFIDFIKGEGQKYIKK